MSFSTSSRARLTEHDIGRFPGETLFDRIGRAVCGAGALPRRELFEAWEVARRVRRRFKGGRVVDIAGGHGLLAHVLLLLDRSSASAVVVDRVLPPSHAAVHAALVNVWPALEGRVRFNQADLSEVALDSEDLVVSSHACGALTDAVLERASQAGARVAVLPCCHVVPRTGADALAGWVDEALAIDIRRAVRLERDGYQVWTQHIPDTITSKNRLLLAAPRVGVTHGQEGQEGRDSRDSSMNVHSR